MSTAAELVKLCLIKECKQRQALLMQKADKQRAIIKAAQDQVRQYCNEYEKLISTMTEIWGADSAIVREANNECGNLYDAILNGYADERPLNEFVGLCAFCDKRLHKDSCYSDYDYTTLENIFQDRYDLSMFDISDNFTYHVCAECIADDTEDDEDEDEDE